MLSRKFRISSPALAALRAVLAITFAGLFTTPSGAAQSSAGERPIETLRVLPDGNVLLQSDFREPFKDPAGCNGYGSNNPWVLLRTTHPGFLSLYSLAFSVTRSGTRSLHVYVDGCATVALGSPIGVPVVSSLETAD